ncbi:MAG: arylsulfatase regulator (Fe-S oxidoreductase), partial [Parcubacteria group bacterium GW2011_GWC1_43_61]
MKISRETPLIKSQFLQTVENNSEAVIWHSLFGRPKIVSVQMLEFIRIFAIPQTLNLVYEEYEFDNNEMAYLKEMIVDYFLIPKGFDERSLLSKRMQKREQTITNGSLINYLSLIVSEGCNFRCAYCIHFNNLETSHRIKNSKKFMQFEIAKDAIDRYMGILRQHGKKVAEVNFGGGEPLLAWPVINLILEYCQLTYGKEFLFNFSINTNASLITAKIAKKLKEYNVRTALSIDGLSDGNDKVRLTKAGGKTFNIIVKGFENLMAQYHSLNGITITVNEHNFPYLSEK